MRLWTIHPKYLDAKGLVALWRESLLAKAVLEGKTKGYRDHPQLIRFREHQQPLNALGQFLHVVFSESKARDYSFNARKLSPESRSVTPIDEFTGQLTYEWHHLLKKLSVRDPARHEALSDLVSPDPNPIFKLVDGGVRSWEVVS